MSTLDEDYFLSTWQVGCDWLVKTAGGHEPLIQSFKNIINSEVSGLNGRVPRSDLLWSAASKLWSEGRYLASLACVTDSDKLRSLWG